MEKILITDEMIRAIIYAQNISYVLTDFKLEKIKMDIKEQGFEVETSKSKLDKAKSIQVYSHMPVNEIVNMRLLYEDTIKELQEEIERLKSL